jgi:hypothetical protein
LALRDQPTLLLRVFNAELFDRYVTRLLREKTAFGTKRTRRTRGLMSAYQGTPDSTRTWSQRRLMTQSGHRLWLRGTEFMEYFAAISRITPL